MVQDNFPEVLCKAFVAPVANSAYLIWKLAIALQLIAPESLKKLMLIRMSWSGKVSNKKILQQIDLEQLEPCFGGTLDIKDAIRKANAVKVAAVGKQEAGAAAAAAATAIATAAAGGARAELISTSAAAAAAAAAVARGKETGVVATPVYISRSPSSSSSLSSEGSATSATSRSSASSSLGKSPVGSPSRLAQIRRSRGLSVATEYKLKSGEDERTAAFGFETFLDGVGRDDVEVLEGLLTRNESLVIADATRKDYPIIYCPDSFCELTGYSASEVIGKNCRFLQGEGTDP